jgi:digeranylgeranylglycerophospholipid reductase
MTQPYDLVVAGAGPAGLTLAWKASERGLRVLVFDRKKHAGHVAYTTSASYIDLERWGLPDEISHPISKLHFASPGASFERSTKACVLRRRQLLAEIEKRCLAGGVDIRYGTYARHVDVEDGSVRRVHLSDDSTVEGVVYADGSGLGNVFNRVLTVNRGPATRALGYEVIVPLKAEPETVDLYLGGILKGGYGWVFPIDGEHAIVGVGTLRPEDFPRIRALLDAFLRVPRVSERAGNEPLESHGGVFQTGMPLKEFHRANLVLVGDVAFQGNPAAGEGIRFVMDAAEMASRAIAEAVQSRDLGLLAGYSREWGKRYFALFRANFILQRSLVWLTGRTRLLDFAVRKGATASDETVVTLITGGASGAFLLRKLGRVLYKSLRRGSSDGER